MTTRTEHDSFGPIEVPADRLWGAQTARALRNFASYSSNERMPTELIAALALVKRAVAVANRDLGELAPATADAIVAAADEVLGGEHDAEFPLAVWQTGSGTQTNMNVNEVLANRASELLGGGRGAERRVHPNDDVNRGQSSNDVFPTAMHVAAAVAVTGRLRPALRVLAETLGAKADAFATVLKIGRTHLQDATPITLGQEFSGYARQIELGITALEASLPMLYEVALGGTAVGTGLNAHPRLGETATALLAGHTRLPLVVATNRFAALAGHEALVFAHGALKTVATALAKIADDIRWLASGPRCGLGEIRIPDNEPGSSIMPGKVNPTQTEALRMACVQVFANDVAINVGGSQGNFELNVFKPLIAHAFLQSARLLAAGADSFRTHCVEGIEPDRARLAELVARSLMLVTALAPHIGYDKAAAIATRAHADGSTLRAAAVASGHVTGAQFDAWVRPDSMV